MGVIKNLSNSALDRFAQCPLSFYHAYINEDKPEKRDTEEFYAEFGLLAHFLAEYYPRTNFYRSLPYSFSPFIKGDDINSLLNDFGNQLMTREKPLDLDEMIKIYDYVFPMIKFPDQSKADEYYQQGLEFVKKIPEMDWSKVIGLEQEFEINLQNGVVPITGIIDKVERDDKGLIVTDYKTSKPYSENATLQKRQLPIYGMACYFLYGEIPYKYRYHFVRFDKIVEVEIPISRLTEVKNSIKFNYMQMLSYKHQGKFPAQYSDFYCKKFCGYGYLCERFKQFNGILG